MDAAELVEEINNGEIIEFSPTEGEYDYEISFEDFVAHTLEAEVGRFVENLERAPGVIKVVHEDRERVLVNATTPQADLDRWTRIWWSNRLMEMKTLPDPGGV